MVASLVITLREGLEATLILGIILAYLAKTGNRQHFSSVWLGTTAAAIASVGAAALIFVTVGELNGTAEQIFEGSTMLLAVAVLSYMVVWMREATSPRASLQRRVEKALNARSSAALLLLAFLVVVREGIETVLFLFAAVRTSTPLESTVGAVLGLLLAVGVGYSIYSGGRRLNLRMFFNVTGALLVLFAAGLLAHAVGELQEAGLVPAMIEHVWDTNWLIEQQSGAGSFLRALLGYNASPSIEEVVAYLGYLAIALRYFLFRPSPTHGREAQAGGPAA